MNNIKLKLGDYYRWSYNDITGSTYELSYWCKAKIAVVKEYGGELYLEDIYWHSSSSNYTVPLTNNIELEYLGNLDDYEPLQEYRTKYYDNSDILNLNHPNSSRGNLYVHKNAVVSKDKVLDNLDDQINSFISEIEYKQSQLDRLLDDRAKLVRCELEPNEVYF